MPRLRLKYKSYAAPGISLKKGDILGVSEGEAERLMKAFPDWWEKVGNEPPKAPVVDESAKLGPTKHSPEGSHGKSKRNKR